MDSSGAATISVSSGDAGCAGGDRAVRVWLQQQVGGSRLHMRAWVAAARSPYAPCAPSAQHCRLPAATSSGPSPLPAPHPPAGLPLCGLQGKSNLKLSYDLKSENAAFEWNRKPFKVVLSSVVSKKPSVGKPTVAATYENVFEF